MPLEIAATAQRDLYFNIELPLNFETNDVTVGMQITGIGSGKIARAMTGIDVAGLGAADAVISYVANGLLDGTTAKADL